MKHISDCELCKTAKCGYACLCHCHEWEEEKKGIKKETDLESTDN